MRRECRFIAIFFVYFDFEVSWTRIYRLKYSCISTSVDTFVLSRKRLGVPDGAGIDFSIIDAEAESSVLLVIEYDWRCPFRLGGLDQMHLQHSVDFVSLEFVRRRCSAVRS